MSPASDGSRRAPAWRGAVEADRHQRPGPLGDPRMAVLAGVAMSAGSALLLWTMPAAGTGDFGEAEVGFMRGCFLLAIPGGLAAVWDGSRRLSRRAAFLAARAAGKAGAWRLDRDWTPGRSADGALERGRAAAGWITASLPPLALGAWATAEALRAPQAPWYSWGFLALGAGFPACALALWLEPLLQMRRHGESVLRWDGPTPVPPGALWVGEADVGAEVSAPRARLRYIAERPPREDEPQVPQREMKRVVAGAASIEDRRAAGRRRVRVTVQVPRDAPDCEWSRHPSRYWELELVDEAAGFAATFPLPVYRG